MQYESALRTEIAVGSHEQLIWQTPMVEFVVPYDPSWKSAFADESESITRASRQADFLIHHIGSTSIPGILAKPIIDMLGISSSIADADECTAALENLGYEAMGAYGIEGRRYFRKIDKKGTRTHHLHVFEKGSVHIERHLAFRDYLIAHADVAQEYSALKAHLTQSDDHTWESYMDGKDPFIRRVEPKAVDWFRQLRRKSGL